MIDFGLVFFNGRVTSILTLQHILYFVQYLSSLDGKKSRGRTCDRDSKKMGERAEVSHGKLLPKKGDNVLKKNRGRCSQNNIIDV